MRQPDLMDRPLGHQERLIIFTRYPEPGKTKTRLIPALGAAGAAALHRQMAEHTIAQSRRLRTLRSTSIEVQFTGGDDHQMQTWLGHDLCYQPQSTGDLGDRLTHAFQAAFADGITAAIAMGTDCPELDTALLNNAFQTLQFCDVLVGPATDGGYYLIGLRQSIPALFQGIAWSTNAVFSQTAAIAQSLNLTFTTLPTLTDVDYPTDLPVWEQVSGSARGL